MLRDGDRARLEVLTRASTVRAGLATQVRIVLLAAEGVPKHREPIAECTGSTRPTSHEQLVGTKTADQLLVNINRKRFNNTRH